MNQLVFKALLCLVLGSGCATKVSQQSMREKTAGIKKIAVVSVLEDGMGVHLVNLVKLLSEESRTPVEGFDINSKVEQSVAERLRRTGQWEVVIRAQDRERIVECKQRNYFSYPDYNERLKPYLEELKSAENFDAVLILSPFKHIVLDRPVDPINTMCNVPLEGHGVYRNPFNNTATYLACTVSLYMTDTSGKNLYYVKPRVWKLCDVNKWHPKKKLFQANTKFTDFPEEEQKFFLAEMETLITQDLPKSLEALGF